MRRPLATSTALAVFLVGGALAVGVQLVPAAVPEASAAGIVAETGATAVNAPVADLPNEADMMFAAMMIPHHQQAVELARILADTPDIDGFSTALAAFIDSDQSREIAEMEAWMQAWHQTGIVHHEGSAPMTDAGSTMGMATPDQIAEFDAMTGRAAETRFLELMIAHHRGALEMTREALAVGENSYIRALAKHVAAEQEREIEAMTARLGAL